jgi:hypothetical protein
MEVLNKMTQINDTTFYKNSEFNYLKEKGWLIAGTTDNTKFKLSASAIIQFERLIESLPVKDQILIRMQVAGNAEKTDVQVKAYMQ